jgi:three-Cys-motif partner protein
VDDQDSDSILLEAVDDVLPTRQAGQWAKRKLDVLANYIAMSTVAMRKKPWRRRFYIDLQAGPGKNRLRSTGEVFLGSPLLALTKGAGYTDYRFVELDKSCTDALQQRCQGIPAIRQDHIINGDCNIVVDYIVAEIAEIDRWPPYSRDNWHCLSLAFLDPTGLELHWETVRKLALLRRTDIVINFSIYGLRRNARQASEAPDSPIGETVDEFFGTPDWRKIDYKPRGTIPAYEWIEFYKGNLSKLGYLWGSHVPVKNDRGGELYRLLFASKDELGIKLWEEACKRLSQPPLL